MVGVLLVLASVSAGCDANAQVSNQPGEVRAFVQAVVTGDVDRIAGMVRYPLVRPHPVPPVVDATDFARRFAELLPDALLNEIAAQNEGDWERMGWRGVMFQSGRLWVGDDGLLFRINDESKPERQRMLQLIASDRASLHESLRDYREPVLHWRSEGFRVRVDRTKDGSLRYTSWRRDAKLDAEPDLVLVNGAHRFDGSGGNAFYEWQNGQHIYTLAINRIGTDETVPLELIVTTKGEVVVSQAAEPFYPRFE